MQLSRILRDVPYRVAGKEVAPTTGTPHLQIMFTMKNATTWRALKRKLDRGQAPVNNLQQVKRTPDKAAAYCKKGPQSLSMGTVNLDM